MNTFGYHFRITIFGASHSEFVGITLDGVPAGLNISEKDFRRDLDRRNYNYIGKTPRVEQDIPEIISGIFNDFTTGSPITILFKNQDVRSQDYNQFVPRPSHGDFAIHKKYSGFNDYRGGGASSGRMTVAIVAAGVIAKKLIPNIKIQCEVVSLRNNTNIEEELKLAIERNDSIGGVLRCSITGVPIGLGEPFFNSLESALSHIIFSIPGIKSIEFGDVNSLICHYGSEVNDSLISTDGNTGTNYSGGINAGISNGNEIYFSVAARPTPSIPIEQNTINIKTGEKVKTRTIGRHDTCFAMRLPVIIESAAAIVLADFFLSANNNIFNLNNLNIKT